MKRWLFSFYECNKLLAERQFYTSASLSTGGTANYGYKKKYFAMRSIPLNKFLDPVHNSLKRKMVEGYLI